jgi:hypothetical protein
MEYAYHAISSPCSRREGTRIKNVTKTMGGNAMDEVNV